MPFRNEKQALSLEKKNPCQCNSTACILTQVWPPEVLLPLCRTPDCSPAPCGEVVARGGAAPGSEDPHAQPLLWYTGSWNGALCALWLSLLAAEHPNPGLVLGAVPPASGEHAAGGDRLAG